MKITLIHNTGAGSANGNGKALVAMLRDAGHVVRYQTYKTDGWKQALDEPADAIAVVGGDGTIGKVAKRMAGRGIPLAPLPAGTANNIAHALGLDGRPDEELARGWEGARRARLDVAEVSGAWGGRKVIEGMGAGLFANVRPHVDDNPTVQSIPRTDAKVSYIQQLLKECVDVCEPTRIEARVDGEDVSGEYLLFEAMVLPYVGPNLHLAPDSKPGDGQFDLVMVSAQERARLRQYLESWRDDKPRIAVLPSRRGRVLELNWGGYPLHVDGKTWPKAKDSPAAGPVRFAVTDQSVEFLVPDPKKRR
jgi:diacylglycerol kinase (ATP)